MNRKSLDQPANTPWVELPRLKDTLKLIVPVRQEGARLALSLQNLPYPSPFTQHHARDPQPPQR